MNSGVEKYITGVATVANSFPVDFNGVAHVCCTYCKYHSKSANMCRLTFEIIYKPESYTGNRCPLEVQNEKIDF